MVDLGQHGGERIEKELDGGAAAARAGWRQSVKALCVTWREVVM